MELCKLDLSFEGRTKSMYKGQGSMGLDAKTSRDNNCVFHQTAVLFSATKAQKHLSLKRELTLSTSDNFTSERWVVFL